MSIEWREELSIDKGPIDDDHKHLVMIINKYEAAANQQRVDFDLILRLLRELRDYTEEHFAREEELQVRALYPFHDAHKHEHADLVRKFDEMVIRFKEVRQGAGGPAFVRDLGKFLRQWLIDHIINSDRRMIPYVKRMHNPNMFSK